jgi:mRNA-degrading endonuclease RelE of RelBE toxin-antitoxin system
MPTPSRGKTAAIKGLDALVARAHTSHMATVTLTRDALRQFAALPRAIKARVRRLTRRLADWPEMSGAKPLRGPLVGRLRLRTGDYRLQFRVEGDNVIVEKIGHRDRFYEEKE